MKNQQLGRTAQAVLGIVIGMLAVPGALYAEEAALEAWELALAGNPFKQEVEPVDPISKEPVDDVLLGPVYKTRSKGNADFYRMVTFYNIDERRERIHQLPIHREHCGEGTTVPFASYSFSYTYSAKVGVGVNIEGVGLNADFSKSKTLTTNRQLTAAGSREADHIPVMLKQNWEGKTYLQTANTKTGAEEIQMQREPGFPRWMQILFPIVAYAQEYPMPFKVDDAAWTLIVEQKVLRACDSDADRAKPTKKSSKKKAAMKNEMLNFSQ